LRGLEPEQTTEAVVFDLQRYTIHDGPGIRTAVFFKGCPLRCLWCSNPEGISARPQVGVYAKDCIGVEKCGWCLAACPEGRDVLRAKEGLIVGVDRESCTGCLRCVGVCPNDTLRGFGRAYTRGELMESILADRAYYQNSGGGVTLTGGDPLHQHAFVRTLLQECRRYGIHTCVESELHCSRRAVESVLPFTDLILTDLKHMDPECHRRFTGRTNTKILSNIRYLVSQGQDIVLRIPVVPGYNDSEENIRAVARFVAGELGNRVRQLQLLPYRVLGKEKYEALAMPYPMGDMRQPPREEYEPNLGRIAETLRLHGVPAVAGTGQKLDRGL
jgi:pyruvate formate lyase activating enzyme